MRTIVRGPGGDEWPPSTWKPLRDSKGERSATFVCPNGHLGMLTDHAIAADGTVDPSVVCPVDGCGFHDFIALAGWDE